MNQVEEEKKRFKRVYKNCINRENGASRDRDRLLLLAQQCNDIHANKKEIKKKKAHRVVDEKQRVKVRSVYLE